MGLIGQTANELLSVGGQDDIRLTDPVTGAGLFTMNTDPNVVGIDPLTGLDAPIGTDLGFGMGIRSLFASGIYNGDFRMPPPNTAIPIQGDTSSALYNILPYWRHEDQANGRITMTWVTDSSGGSIRIDQAADAISTDVVYLETYVPIAPLTGLSVTRIVSLAGGVFSSTKLQVQIETQYLDASGATTGSAASGGVDAATAAGATLTSLATTYLASVPNGNTGAPADAAYLRIRIIGSYYASGADSVTIDHAFVWMQPSQPRIVAVDLTASQNDWNPAGLQGCDALFISPSGPGFSITGMDATGILAGRTFKLVNASSADSFVLSDLDAASSAANRFTCPNGASVTVRKRGSVWITRGTAVPSGSDRWFVMGA